MEKGAYIYLDEHNIINLFLFMKCSQEELKIALPLNYMINELSSEHDTLIAVFHNGCDYLGSNKLENIPEIIKEKQMINLLENTYKELSNYFSSLSKSKYNSLVTFSKSQLKIKDNNLS